MSWIIRLFLLSYAVAMMAVLVAIGWDRFQYSELIADVWAQGGGLCAAYLVLAVAVLITKRKDAQPSASMVAVMITLAASQLIPSITGHGSGVRAYVAGALTVIPAAVYLVASRKIYYWLRQDTQTFVTCTDRTAAWVGLILGSALTLSTLFLSTTFGGRGWGIVLGKARWVTAYANVGNNVSEQPDIPWLQPFFGPPGRVVYVVALAATLVLTAWCVRAPVARNAERFWSALPAFGGIFTFAVFWIYTDIYWGWHFALADRPAVAVCATVLWLAGPVLFLMILGRRSFRLFDRRRAQMLILFQAPIALFNCFALPYYFNVTHEIFMDLSLQGLAALMAGLQLQSWACTALLAGRLSQEEKPELVHVA